MLELIFALRTAMVWIMMLIIMIKIKANDKHCFKRGPNTTFFIRAGIVTLNMIIVQRQKQQVMFGQNSMSGKCLFFRCGVFAVKAKLLCQVNQKNVFVQKEILYRRLLGQHCQVLAGHTH